MSQKPESLLTLKVELPKGAPPAKRPRTNLTVQHSNSNSSNSGVGSINNKPIPRIKQQPRVSKQNVCLNFIYFLFFLGS
jgi:hypothetical protein